MSMTAESERLRKNQLLQESEERFRMMVESLIDYAMYMLDPQGNIASWNAGAARIYGYQSAEIEGQHLSCLSGAPGGQRRGNPPPQAGGIRQDHPLFRNGPAFDHQRHPRPGKDR